MTYTNATRTRLFSHSLTHFFSQRILYRLVLVRRAWSDGPCSALALHYICPPPHQLAPHFVLAASFLDLPEACPACCCWVDLPAPRRRRRRRRCRRRAAAAHRSRYLFVTLFPVRRPIRHPFVVVTVAVVVIAVSFTSAPSPSQTRCRVFRCTIPKKSR